MIEIVYLNIFVNRPGGSARFFSRAIRFLKNGRLSVSVEFSE